MKQQIKGKVYRGGPKGEQVFVLKIYSGHEILSTGSCRDGWNVRTRSNVRKILHRVSKRVDCVHFTVLLISK